MLDNNEAAVIATRMYREVRSKDRNRLEKLDEYATGNPKLAWLPYGAPQELQALSRASRVNVMDLIVKSSVQQLHVEGYHSETPGASEAGWDIWQRNKMDRRQSALHRSACTFGVGYVVTLPGDPVPVVRPVSALRMTTGYYSPGAEWPDFALEHIDGNRWRLYDSTSVYDLVWDHEAAARLSSDRVFETAGSFNHEMGVCPVTRYLSDDDLDHPVRGDVEPMIPLQDQLNIVSFHLLTASHYGAHGRTVIVGRMLADLERDMMAAGSNSTTLIDADPDTVRIDEVSQTDLNGFIETRRSLMETIGAMSQTPVHELLGSMANLSAAALVESRESTERKVESRKITLGEAHEQVLGDATRIGGYEVDPFAQVRWKQPRLSQMGDLVEVLASVSEKLGVPQEALWEHLPFSPSDIEEFRSFQSAPAADPVDPGPGAMEEVQDIEETE